MEENAKDVVISFLEALNQEDFADGRSYVHDNMTFEGVMGSRAGGDVYFEDMKKMKFKYALVKVFENEGDVCIWYNINMGPKTILSCGWYVVQDGRIRSIKVIFDPRPLLEARQ